MSTQSRKVPKQLTIPGVDPESSEAKTLAGAVLQVVSHIASQAPDSDEALNLYNELKPSLEAILRGVK